MKIKNSIFIILCIIAIAVMTSSCFTPTPVNNTHPQLNNTPFTNYVPWWATNGTHSVTNK